MKRIFLLVAILLLVQVVALYDQIAVKTQTGTDYAQDRILFKLKPEMLLTVDPRQVGDDILQVRGSRTEPVGELSAAATFKLHLDGNLSVDEAVAMANADPRIEYAEPDHFIYPAETVPNDPMFADMWGLNNTGVPFGKPGADIAATRAWDITTGNDSVIVAVIDGGIEVSHPDLEFNIWENPGEIPGNGVDDDGNGFADDVSGWNFFTDDNQVGPDASLGSFLNHGTHVAGTIGAVGDNGVGVAGVAWDCEIISIRIFGNQEGRIIASSSDTVASINYALALKRAGVNIRVINASWGGPSDSRTLHDAIAVAGEAGISFVCAAGNAGSNVDNSASAFFPAGWRDLPSLISVASVDRNDNIATSSNFGKLSIGVGAPGVGVLSTITSEGYGILSGTSMASPHVAGIVALLATHEPGLSPAAIRQRVESTAEPIVSLATRTISAGRANAHNALMNTPAPVGTPAVAAVEATKKFLFVDGINFVRGSSKVEVNGVALDKKMKFLDGFQLANGSFIHVEAKVGKFLMNDVIPIGIPVSITVFNTTTGLRSAPFSFTRR
jgi:subtilisin family serine protease